MGLETKAGASESRFAAYVEAIASALGHADRAAPFQSYCAGLLLPDDRKSVEPMAARAAGAGAGGASVAPSLRGKIRLVGRHRAGGGARARPAHHQAAWPDPRADHRRHRHAEERPALGRRRAAGPAGSLANRTTARLP